MGCSDRFPPKDLASKWYNPVFRGRWPSWGGQSRSPGLWLPKCDFPLPSRCGLVEVVCAISWLQWRCFILYVCLAYWSANIWIWKSPQLHSMSRKSSWSGTRNVINELLKRTVETGFITAATASLELILFYASPHTNIHTMMYVVHTDHIAVPYLFLQVVYASKAVSLTWPQSLIICLIYLPSVIPSPWWPHSMPG